MKKLLMNGVAALCFIGLSSGVWATDFGSPEEAKAMLEKAVTAMQADEASAWPRSMKARRDSKIAIYTSSAGVPTECSPRMVPIRRC
jgi:hypothetical protein